MRRIIKSLATVAFAALAGPLAAQTTAGASAFTITPPFVSNAVSSCTDMTISSGIIDSQGYSSSVVGSAGNLISNGNIKVSGGTVNGNATAGPGKLVTISGSGHVTGTVGNESSTYGCTPIDLASLATTLQNSNDDATIPLSGQKKNPLGGATHTEFTLSGGDTLTLAGGTYYFTKFTISGGSTITITGPVRILCTGTVDISGGSFVNKNPYWFRFWSSGSGNTFTLSGGSNLYGFIYVPNGTATISSSRLLGSVFANAVTVSGSSHVTRVIDDVAPVIAITSPPNNSTISNPASVSVTGTVSDDTAVTVQVNGQTVTVNPDGTWQTTLNLSGAPSPVTITATATDAAGTKMSANVSLITVPPPALTLTLPPPDAFVNTRVTSLSGGTGSATTVTVNGHPATVANGVWSITNFDLGTDGSVTLTIVGTNSGGSSTITPHLFLDTVAPTIQVLSVTPAPNAAGWNNNDVTVKFTCTDSGSGIKTCGPDVTISTEGAGQQVVGTAVDNAGNSAPVTATLNIDKTAPHFTFTAPAQNALLSTAKITVTGGSDDAVTATVNGVAAVIDPVAKTFTATVTLLEGNANIVVSGADIAGNTSSAPLPVVLDTQAPHVVVTAPAPNACTNASSLDIKGTVSDPNFKNLNVQLGSNTVNATVTNGAWVASFSNLPEGKDAFTIQASDNAGHTSTLSLTVNVDRTKPVIAVTEGGVPFTATLVNRAVSLFIRVTDADPSPSVSVTLDGAAYAQGTPITAEGPHTVAATATDCAGNTSQTTLSFTIDRTAPSLSNLSPVNASTVGSIPTTIQGTASEAATVSISGTAISANTDGSNHFVLNGVPFVDGVNKFVLHTVDHAGNASDTAYSATVRSKAPVLTITENGVPMVSGTTYNRIVKPVVSANATDDTVTAQLNGAAFTSGNAVSPDGSYTLNATATDPVGHTSNASVTFTIDRTPPVVKITSPADGATIDAASTVITVNAPDAVSVLINGAAATGSAGNFTATVPLDGGSNLIIATGTDAAGNHGTAQITVNRAGTSTGVVLTYPPEGFITNRPTIIVTGRVLTPANVKSLTLEGHVAAKSTGTIQVVTDPSGAFSIASFTLFEGVDTITATTTTADGKTSSAVVHVTTDLTTPTAQILAGGVALDDGAHLAAATTLTVNAADAPIAGVTPVAPVVTLLVDGVAATQPAAVSANGGHSAVAIVTDGAGNQTRVERSFSIGAQQSGGCGLTGFDPKDGSVVTANSTTLIGRSGGAAGVKINNIPALVANGMFAGTVELSVEGPNTVTIVCTDASGTPTGTPVTITLNRVTAAPSVTIDNPTELAPFGTSTITVSGGVQNATSVDVNGTPATITGGTYSAANVRLTPGLNILLAHARNSAGAMSIASRRVLGLQNAPSISITWPSDGFTTGATSIDVSGTYTNLNPATLASAPAGTGPVDPPHPGSDTTGSFTIHGVPLAAGQQTVTVTGQDALNNSATATVNVTVAAGPSISITSPANNSYLPAGSSVPVTGSYSGAEGSQVDVNGTAATADTAHFTYSGAAPFSATNPTVITAHVQQPDGNAAIATVLVNQLATNPTVKNTFPENGATAVDPGVMVLVSFSAPMDASTVRNSFTLTGPSNTIITGQLRVDKDVLSFAPATTLTPGGTYTADVKTTAKDLAGNPLASEVTFSFTIATTAPTTAPVINPIAGPICASSVTISGTAPASAALVIEMNGVPNNVTADATGKYSVTLTIPQVSAYVAVRARIVGQDGTYSPSFSTSFQVDCSGAQVLGAAYDRSANAITITFSKAIDTTSVIVGASGSVQLAYSDGTQLAGSVAAGSTSSAVVITPSAPSGAADPRTSTINLLVTTNVKDTTGRNIAAPFPQTFTATGTSSTPNDGNGYISGQIFDAANGRGLAGTSIAITAANATTVSASTDLAGHYTPTPRVPEGAYAIHVSAPGYTDVYRQVVVAAGQGVVPIDIRLTRRGKSATMASADLTVSHGGDDSLTRKATLTIPGGTAATGTIATLTAVGGQGLPGLLPLGWSPLAAAEIHVQTPAATLLGAATANVAFQLTADVAASGRAITAVGYDASRDQWDVLQPVVSIDGNNVAKVNFALPATSADSSGANSGTTAVALVYPDVAPLAAPPAPLAGGTLTGVADPCASGACPAFMAKSFTLNPAIVTPTQRTVATLLIDSSNTTPPAFPSGTAIDALVNEELRLVDGSILTDQPFSTDLLLYRSLDSKSAIADFHLAPSTNASQPTLQIGFDHIQILPYPGRLDRGTLIGPAGGHVPSDEQVQVDIPTGATSDALHAAAASMSSADLQQFGSIDGFQIVAGFTLTLDPATTTQQPFATTQLVKSATATFTVDPAVVGSAPQLVLAEVLPQTTFGRMFHLAGTMAAPQPIASSTLLHFATAPVNPAVLPVDGIVRPGQYLLLLAKQPIAFATGTVAQSTGVVIAGAGVTTASLGMRDLSRATGVYAIPVVAAPASPFSLTPLHPTLGDGVPYAAATAPVPNAVVPVNLTFAVQAPSIQSVIVTGPTGAVDLKTNNGATGISLSTGVQVTFNQSIDGTSVNASSITVTGSNGQLVNGATTPNGTALTWALALGNSLAVNSTYSVTVSGTVRGSHGAPLGTTKVYTFSSVTQLTSTQINASKIRITIPDANGISTIVGDPGALPTVPPEPHVWSVVGVRRGNAFITQYQTQANNDGSFTLKVGTCGGSGKCADSITIYDHIDLDVLNAASNVAAVIPLTPFVTADGQGFVAPPDQTTTFTSKDGATITVPAGAFDQPTIVAAHRVTTADSFAAVPGFSTELGFYGGLQLSFDCTGGVNPSAPPCVAHKKLDVSIPLTVDPGGKTFLLGKLGQSVLGPRIMIVDTLKASNGQLVTGPSSTAQSMRASTLAAKTGPAKVQTIVNADVRSYLQGVDRSGIYSAVDIRVAAGASLGWAAIDSLGGNQDIFDSLWSSLYLSHEYLAEGHGRAIMPVLAGVPFSIVGYDAGTGLQAFSKAYDPLPVSDPGVTYVIDPPSGDDEGPYPVFISPGTVEIVDLVAANDPTNNIDLTITRPNLKVSLTAGNVEVDDTLPDAVIAHVLNVSKGHYAQATLNQGGGGHTAIVAGDVGDRIVIIEGQKDVDPDTQLSVVFSKPFDTGTASTDPEAIDQSLHGFITVERAVPPDPNVQPVPPPQYFDVSKEARYEVDSGGARLKIIFPASLQRGQLYRINLGQNISEISPAGSTTPALKIDQVRINNSVTGDLQNMGAQASVSITFQVREVQTLGSFSLPQWTVPSGTPPPTGTVRDYALNGNLLFISALDGGVLAYDASDPAALKDPPAGSTAPRPKPISRLPQELSSQQYWAIASDQHGRVYTTSVGDTFGYLTSLRLEDFIAAGSNPPSVGVVPPKAESIVSWAPGSSLSLDIDTIISDRPEGIPRKLQLAEQDVTVTTTLANFIAQPPAGIVVQPQAPDGDFSVLNLIVTRANGFPYVSQRVTIENATRDMRWSVDAYQGGTQLNGIAAEDGDTINVIFNQRTYGVVTIFGYGIGVFDLNAIDSNHDPNRGSAYQPIAESVKVTAADTDYNCNPIVDPTAIANLALSPDDAMIGAPVANASDPPALIVYGVDVHRGVLDDVIHPKTTTSLTQEDCNDRGHGILLTAGVGNAWIDAIDAAFNQKFGRKPFARFNGIQTFHWHLEALDNKPVVPPSTANPNPPPFGQRHSTALQAVDRDYLLVPGNELGLIILDATYPAGALQADDNPLNSNVADVIWVPGGAAAVRVIPRTHYCVVVDGTGRVLLVDLANIDERWNADGSPVTSHLFGNVATALGETSPFGNGGLDPRIVWISNDPLVTGTLPPVIDVDTGMVYAGSAGGTTTNVIAALDPPIRLYANLGNGKMEEIGGVVPLGVKPPDNVLHLGSNATSAADASLAAFRVEVSLPGKIADIVTQQSNGKLPVTIESERVAGQPVEQTPELVQATPFPRAHFRAVRPDGLSDSRALTFTVDRDIPATLASKLKYQKGFNHFISKWIIAIADPRASKSYQWQSPQPGVPADKTGAGCYACDRPASLVSKDEPDVYEIWSGGRDFAIKPELKLPASGQQPTTIFDGTPYAYLAQANRFVKRFPTVMADTVRSLDVVSASQAPPIAGGAVAGSIFMHSGEVALTANDLSAGGRAGWNVDVDRTYRSSTMLPSPFGLGWTSSMFRRLRELPGGAVEYRDGSGEVWLFKVPNSTTTPAYVAPAGLLLRLVRTPDGWEMVDMKRRITTFDDLGRILTESDEFGGAGFTGTGNTIRYLYDITGRLAAVVDPLERATKIAYWDYAAGVDGWKVGRVKSITDWRQRKVDYDYDSYGRLLSVRLAAVSNVVNADGNNMTTRPAIVYGQPSFNGGPFNDAVELLPELSTVSDPSYNSVDDNANVTTSKPRIQLGFGSGNDRGKLTAETLYDGPSNVAGSTVSVDYSSLKVTDALGHARSYTLTSTARPADYNAARQQFQTMTDTVQVAGEIGQLPIVALPGAPSLSPKGRTFTFGYSPDPAGTDTNQQLSSIKLDGAVLSTYAFQDAPAAPGPVVKSATEHPLFSTLPNLTQTGNDVAMSYNYQNSDGLFLASVGTPNDGSLNMPEPHRGFTTPSAPNDVQETDTYTDSTGLLSTVQTTGGTDTQAGNSSSLQIGYWPDTDSMLWRRAMPMTVTRGADTTTKYEYDQPQRQITVTDSRDVKTVTTLDEWDRPVDVRTQNGPELTLHTAFTYYASGQVHTVQRDQSSLSNNGSTVTTTYAYDILGRLTDVKTDQIQVDAVPTTVEKKITFAVPATTVTTVVTPPGTTTTVHLDDLSRPSMTEVDPGTSPTIKSYFGYDIAGNLVFQSGNFTAQAMAYDAAGRLAGVLRSDNTSTSILRDGWGNPTEVRDYDASNQVYGHVLSHFTPTGRVKDSTTDTGNNYQRTATFAWDGAGLTSSTVVAGTSNSSANTSTGSKRAIRSLYDSAGRQLSTAFGAGDLGQNIPDPFMKSSVSTFAHQSSDFPEMTTLTEGPSAVTQPRSYQQTLNYDTPGDVTKVDVNGLSFEQHFDEAGNVVRTKEPSQDPNVDLTTTYQYDGRGKVATETKPGSPNNPVKYEWSSTGVAAKYTDEQGEKTTSASTDRDLLGRPLRRVYQDGTTEQFVWDGPRLRSYTNRSGQLQTFEYYPNTDRLFRITYGSTVEILTYDDAGRLKTWTTPGAILTYSNYDKEGHPGQTAVTRIAPDGATQLATYTQTHTWNAHGERMAWTMPRSTAPTVPWTDTVNEDHDEAGNVIGITRTLFGSTSSVPSSVLAAQFLNAGRPFQRTITTDCSAISACNAASIVRNYDYNSVGQMSRVEVQSAGQTVAGSQVAFDGVRISDIQILGISGDTHHSKFHYDARGRLDGMIPDTTDANANATSASVPGRIGLSYDDTDFLSQKARTPLDPSAAVVQSTFTPTSAGHKVQSLGSQTFTYGGNPTTGAGANLVDDGKYVYEWDAKDELIAVIQKPLTTASPIRRIRYFYDGNGRIVGRRAESANVTTLSDPLDALQWQLETNPSILAGDGLPADTTFVWDPISDQLVSVFDTNASPTDPNGGLLRQYLHGGIGYDDPIEVTVNFSQTAQGGLQRLYPVFDEAGTGSL
ncbi:MAG TPA: Ig-like domain-containing protein, partial [Thermoanaerobaculia bacterium]|nr:Ig-like domain-containing protein [Thermoanaerobaculia bacterium]